MSESIADLAAFAKKRGLSLGESSEKVGGARNDMYANTGKIFSYNSVALCFPMDGIVVVVLANTSRDNDSIAGRLVNVATS